MIDSKTNSYLLAGVLAGVIAAMAMPAVSQVRDDSGTEDEIDPYYPVNETDNPDTYGWVKGKNQWKLNLGFSATPEGGEAVGDAIEGSYALCALVQPDDYLVDCLAEQLEEIAAALPPTGDYAEAKEILEDAAQEMRALVRANANPAKPRIRATGRVAGKRITTKPLTPVLPARNPAVKAQAAKILEETQTKLLRSAQNSDKRLIAYANMAKAVGSNKTLLRSA